MIRKIFLGYIGHATLKTSQSITVINAVMNIKFVTNLFVLKIIFFKIFLIN